MGFWGFGVLGFCDIFYILWNLSFFFNDFLGFSDFF